MMEDVQAFRVRGHHAVLDTVVDHLHKVPRAIRSAVQIAVLGGASEFLATRCTRCFFDPRSESAKNRLESLDDVIVAADHQAIAALRSPHSAAGAGIDVMDSL